MRDILHEEFLDSMTPIVPKPKGMPTSMPVPSTPPEAWERAGIDTFVGDDGNVKPVLAKKMPRPLITPGTGSGAGQGL